MSHDNIADMLTKIRNASMAGHERVDIPLSKVKLEITKILKNEGYIKNFKLVEENGRKDTIRIFLKFMENGTPVLEDLQRVSRPGLRVYKKSEEIPRFRNGLGVIIISTSKGIITGKKARDQKVGGEILCCVW